MMILNHRMHQAEEVTVPMVVEVEVQFKDLLITLGQIGLQLQVVEEVEELPQVQLDVFKDFLETLGLEQAFTQEERLTWQQAIVMLEAVVLVSVVTAIHNQDAVEGVEATVEELRAQEIIQTEVLEELHGV